MPSCTVLAPMQYAWPIRELIHAYKFHGQLPWAPLFSELMLHYLKSQPAFTMPEALLAVPLHRHRLRERGFNQSFILAKHLARAYQVPVIHACDRIKNTLAQHALKKSERKKNLQSVFLANPSIRAFKHIAIVDDIMTSGATLDAMVEALKCQHPQLSIQAWCLARAY